jgi:predicted transcriptional regulator
MELNARLFPRSDHVLPDDELSKAQIELVEQFEADYNAVDSYLRKTLAAEKQVSFTQLVNKYSEKHRGWSDGELLRTIADIRNAIVHGRTEPYRYVAIPTSRIAQQLSTCRDRLVNPARAIPSFQRTVEIVSLDESLAGVLNKVDERDYSQFPAYQERQFRGLLTENGITRWIAHHVATELSLIDLAEIPVAHVLKSDENRKNWKFVSRTVRVDDVRGLFASQPVLEAVLITANGNQTEKLLGIATRWDVLQLR